MNPDAHTDDEEGMVREPKSLDLSLMELRDAVETEHGTMPGTFKWAHGDDPPYRFCGHDTAFGESYCAYHHLIVYQPVYAHRSRQRQAERDVA